MCTFDVPLRLAFPRDRVMELDLDAMFVDSGDSRRSVPWPDLEAVPEFSRVGRSYDLRVLATARLLVVGAGGSAGFVEDLARCGLGQIVLIDPDVVEPTNVATQQVYRSDMGRSKVEALARRLVDVSPHLRVWTVRAPLDALSDRNLEHLAFAPLPFGDGGSARTAGGAAGWDRPACTLLCGFTDDFWTQARVNRVALHLGIPQLSGGVYREGRGAEVVFTAPGVTAACARCALHRRYEAYLREGYVNDVGSAGAPLWATARLNALKAPIALALVHRLSPLADPRHPATVRYRRLLEVVSRRNLAIARLDPDLAITLGLRAFEAGGSDSRRPVEDVLWLEQSPEGPATGIPACPDCGGLGDLRSAIGQFVDTRPMPYVYGEHRRLTLEPSAARLPRRD